MRIRERLKRILPTPIKREGRKPKPTRQQRRKLQRDLRKLKKKVDRRAEQTLKDTRIPAWIREVKRSQLEANGFLTTKKPS